MHHLVKLITQYSLYPVLMGGIVLTQWYFLETQIDYFPWSPIFAGIAIILVAVFERLLPYRVDWLHDRQDTLPDVLHAVVSLTLIFSTFYVVELALSYLNVKGIWPGHWHPLLQLLLAGSIIDFGMWFMHWLSHRNRILWQLHALHHSSTRLYWLNGERRHPVSALILGVPGILTVLLLGAGANITGAWMIIVAVHLALQHANLDYRLGPMKYLIAGAQMHRWHHKKEYENAQVNFGECFLVWDHLFGTFYSTARDVKAAEVGMVEKMPLRYFEQLIWPFRQVSTSRYLAFLLTLTGIVILVATLLHALFEDVSLFHGIILHPLFLLGGFFVLILAYRRGKRRRCHY